jgi:hypothetical protein
MNAPLRTPPQTRPLVSDVILEDLATPNHDELRGEYSDERRALLAMILPDIADELLTWRRAANQRPFALSMALRSETIAHRLDNARRTIRAPEPIFPGDLREACETLIRHSSDPFERDAARDVLAQIKGVA